MATFLCDFHCHLDLYPDHAESIAECEREKVFALTVTTTPKAWPRNHQLASTTHHVRAALGLHPQLVSERASELALWKEYLPLARYVGEVGLDAGPQFYRSLDLQKEVFKEILQACASSGDKVLSVHSVRAAKAVLDMVEQYVPPPRASVVLHWFTGSKAEARRAVDLGCYFSINSEMTASTRHRETLAALPIERLLTETDGPFTKTDGRPTRPTDVIAVIGNLGRCFDLDAPTMSAQIRSNLVRLLHDDIDWMRE